MRMSRVYFLSDESSHSHSQISYENATAYGFFSVQNISICRFQFARNSTGNVEIIFGVTSPNRCILCALCIVQCALCTVQCIMLHVQTTKMLSA